jgi:enterochelin esterase family protein
VAGSEVRLGTGSTAAFLLVLSSCAGTASGSLPSLGPVDGSTDSGAGVDSSGGVDEQGDRPVTPPPSPDGGTESPDAPAVDPAGDGEMTIGPDYPPAPEWAENPAVPKGTVFAYSMSSSDSKIFPAAGAGNPQPFVRSVWFYVPKQYADGTPAPLLVVQDGASSKNDLPRVLDNLIAAKAVPALVALMIDAGPSDLGNQRSIELDTISHAYVDFIEQEALPAVTAQEAIRAAYPGLRFTTNPEGRASMGCSSGGIAAFTMGWLRPDLYRRILSYSGSFTDRLPDASYPHGGWEYPEHLIADAPAKPLRVYLQVGEKDLLWDSTDLSLNWPAANRTLAAALAARGYHYQLVIASGAGHCNGAVRAHTLPDALRWLWRGYPSTK